MRRKKLIIAGLMAGLSILAIILIIKELHLLPAEVGVMVVRDDADPTEDLLQPDGDEEQVLTVDAGTQQNLTPPTIPTETEQQNASTTMLQEDSQMFRFTELSQEIKDRITGISYPEQCEVPYDELRYVEVLYIGFDGETHTGELIVNRKIAQDIVDIFRELYEQRYPIEKMVLIDEFKADDNASMAADNTSAFNYRPIDDGSGRLSLHSYGLAIDINPLYNPYVREVDGTIVISPENGAEYADRSLDCEYYIRKDDICWKAFTSRGFTWGGDWKNQKDYQHFQKKPD